MATIKQVLSGRALIGAYRTTSKSGIQPDDAKLLSDLQALGFASFQDFFDQSELANWKELARCYTWEGTCDLCAGRQRGCCVESANFGWYTASKQRHEVEKVIGSVRQRIQSATVAHLDSLRSRANGYRIFYNWRHSPNHLPPNCAYRLVKLAEPSIDIYWNMSTSPDDSEHLGDD